jgi:hypothetical protein
VAYCSGSEVVIVDDDDSVLASYGVVDQLVYFPCMCWYDSSLSTRGAHIRRHISDDDNAALQFNHVVDFADA